MPPRTAVRISGSQGRSHLPMATRSSWAKIRRISRKPTGSDGGSAMKRSFFLFSVTALAVVVACAPASAQKPAGKKVAVGYGLDKDQPVAGADPDGTGLPWKEAPPEAVAAAKQAPTPHLADGHPDLTGFWAPAGWGYAVTQGKVSADGKVIY